MTTYRLSTRRRSPTRRRGRWLAATAAALLLLIVLPLSMGALSRTGVSLPGSSSIASLMAMLDQRSPGERTTGELNKTKKKRSSQVLATSWPDLRKTIRPVAPLASASPLLPPAAPFDMPLPVYLAT